MNTTTQTQSETKQTIVGKSERSNPMNSTQTHLRIGEIRDDVLVLKNGGMRAILKTSSINFNLKSEQEQNSIIYGYQGFLNSLEFPIQILVRSQKLDIDNYIAQVKEIAEKQTNPLLQEQTFEYAEYIRKLIDYADIMSKEFYVIVPYDPGRTQGPDSLNFLQSFFQRLSPKDTLGDVKRRFEEFSNLKKSLMQRVNIAKSGLENCGLKVEQLKTVDIIKLFYNALNPISSRSVKMNDLEKTNIISDDEKLEQ
ncbi:MAG: hypothetical protein WC806_01815 [Candidatus Gracilibacteria bacterium]|jgi:hypothetical protein